MIVVKNKKDLKQAITRKEKVIPLEGKIASKLKILAKVKPLTEKEKNTINLTTGSAAAAIATGTGVSVAIAITLIVTCGIVSIVAILKDYRIEVSKDNVTLVRNDKK